MKAVPAVGEGRASSGRRLASWAWVILATHGYALTLLSALLYLLGTWSPWQNVFSTFTIGDGQVRTASDVMSGSMVTFGALLSVVHYHSSRAHLLFDAFQAAFFLWDALPLCGMLLSVALWWRSRPSRRLTSLYVAWLAVATALAAVGVYSAATTTNTQAEWGLWLTLVALALAWVALIALVRGRTGTATATAAAAPSSTAARTAQRARSRSWAAPVGAAVFACGTAVWALGLLFIPWVTAGCTGIPLSFTHFAHGSCQGLDGYDVLGTGFQNGPLGTLVARAGAAFWILDVPYHLIVLLVLAGIVLAVLLWRQGRAERADRSPSAIPVVATVWLLLVTLAFLAGWQGATFTLGHRGAVAFTLAPQVIGLGLWVSAAGILVGWASAVAIWYRARWRGCPSDDRSLAD